jgi:thiamine-phosphate pyrophosphorylase
MSKRELRSPQLCLVTDPNVPELAMMVEMALAAGITMLQVRGPQLTTYQFYSLVQALYPRCQYYGAACIVNAHLAVGQSLQVDGFQLGKHSVSIAAAREMVGNDYLLGASVHMLGEAQMALQQGADYLQAGTIFSSNSHPGEPTAGPQLIYSIKEAYPASRVLAIGGINARNAEQVMLAGADGIAVVSAILGARDVAQTVKDLRSSIGL